MSRNRRRIELIKCDCTEGIGELGQIVCYPENTVHIENIDGDMRCMICGKVKKQDYQ